MTHVNCLLEKFIALISELLNLPLILSLRSKEFMKSLTPIWCNWTSCQAYQNSRRQQITVSVQNPADELLELNSWLKGTPSEEQLKRFKTPQNDTALGPEVVNGKEKTGNVHSEPVKVEENTGGDAGIQSLISVVAPTAWSVSISVCLVSMVSIRSIPFWWKQPDNCRKGLPCMQQSLSGKCHSLPTNIKHQPLPVQRWLWKG